MSKTDEIRRLTDRIAALEVRLNAVYARTEERTERALRALAGMSPNGRLNHLLEQSRAKFDSLVTADRLTAEAELKR